MSGFGGNMPFYPPVSSSEQTELAGHTKDIEILKRRTPQLGLSYATVSYGNDNAWAGGIFDFDEANFQTNDPYTFEGINTTRTGNGLLYVSTDNRAYVVFGQVLVHTPVKVGRHNVYPQPLSTFSGYSILNGFMNSAGGAVKTVYTSDESQTQTIHFWDFIYGNNGGSIDPSTGKPTNNFLCGMGYDVPATQDIDDAVLTIIAIGKEF